MPTDPERLRAWVPLRTDAPPGAPRLFCLPYSGGSAGVYRGWTAASIGAQVCAVQYPGRASRFAEPLARRMDQLVESIAVELVLPLADRPFGLFGHSMGAVIAFELARRLESLGRPPRLVILSGHGLPHDIEQLHLLPDRELLVRLREMGGTPDSFFESAELVEIALPILRADMELLETHVVAPEPRLGCSVVAFAGTDDPIAPQGEVDAWSRLVAGSFARVDFPGGHFFLHEREADVLAEVARRCRDALGA
jgi:medium-chain acyl-[acyl-carrier-protein] hydrolase